MRRFLKMSLAGTVVLLGGGGGGLEGWDSRRWVCPTICCAYPGQIKSRSDSQFMADHVTFIFWQYPFEIVIQKSQNSVVVFRAMFSYHYGVRVTSGGCVQRWGSVIWVRRACYGCSAQQPALGAHQRGVTRRCAGRGRRRQSLLHGGARPTAGTAR